MSRSGATKRLYVAGQEIRRGEKLGQVGFTGRSTGREIHYEVRFDDMPVNLKM
jgi:murein DD-endopeptidase MepM/ murein hydrolase activator NlpD